MRLVNLSLVCLSPTRLLSTWRLLLSININDLYLATERDLPFMASIAASEASNEAKLMNACPLELPVSGSLIICEEKELNLVRINEKSQLFLKNPCIYITDQVSFIVNWT